MAKKGRKKEEKRDKQLLALLIILAAFVFNQIWLAVLVFLVGIAWIALEKKGRKT